MKIYLIRHGESTSDIEGKFGGDYDDHLTDKGKQQAEDLINKIDKNIEVIFHSTRIRATETAGIINSKLKCKIVPIHDLRERNLYGFLTGVNKEEAKNKYPNEVENLKDYNYTIKDGEQYSEFKGRIIDSFKDILIKNYKNIAFITHGGPIKCLFRELFKVGEFKELGDCALLPIDYEDGDIILNYTSWINAELKNLPQNWKIIL